MLKFCKKKNGSLNYSSNFVRRCGNKVFSSTNALKNKDTLQKDDLESLFYILIYFFNGSLPWYDPEAKNKKYSVDEIICIREKIQPSYLCKNFPKEFSDLFEKIIESNEDSSISYSEIIKVFEKIRDNHKTEEDNIKFKFDWLKYFKIYAENKYNIIDNAQQEKIAELIQNYCLNIKNYMKFIEY